MPNFRCTVHGQYNASLTWSFGAGVSSGSTIDVVAALWDTAWTAAWTDVTNGLNQFYPTTTEKTYTRCAELDATYHEIQNIVTPAVQPGLTTGDTLPYQEAIVVRQSAISTKRWNRGRFYLPATDETFVNGNILISTAQNKMALAVKGVYNTITAGGDNVYVVSRKAHKDMTGLYTYTVITKWSVSNKPARQSRRTKKNVPLYV